jgi:hypothetical protein
MYEMKDVCEYENKKKRIDKMNGIDRVKIEVEVEVEVEV